LLSIGYRANRPQNESFLRTVHVDENIKDCHRTVVIRRYNYGDMSAISGKIVSRTLGDFVLDRAQLESQEMSEWGGGVERFRLQQRVARLQRENAT
jgi:hypothetical protein